jgi:hypothetical protein
MPYEGEWFVEYTRVSQANKLLEATSPIYAPASIFNDVRGNQTTVHQKNVAKKNVVKKIVVKKIVVVCRQKKNVGGKRLKEIVVVQSPAAPPVMMMYYAVLGFM